MKVSLWRTLLKYTKTKGILPLDERQMDSLKNLYMELAKSMIIGFMVFMLYYGYMQVFGGSTSFPYIILAMSLVGTITFYYTLRFCYLDIVGLDCNFETVLIPGLIFTPMMLSYVTLFIFQIMLPDFRFHPLLILVLFIIIFCLIYLGANQVFKKGKLQQEKELHNGEQRYRTRKQFVNYAIIISIGVACIPISYDEVFFFFLVVASLFSISNVLYYGFMTPHNVYTLNELGIHYHRALWNRRGGFIEFDKIDCIVQQDTFNLGFAKDKVKIVCKNGEKIYLYPENAYLFCVEIRNNL